MQTKLLKILPFILLLTTMGMLGGIIGYSIIQTTN